MSSYHGGNDMPRGASVTSPALSEAQSQLGQTEQNHARTQRDLQNLMRIRATTQMSTAQYEQMQREIALLQHELRQSQEAIRGLQHTVSQQAATIRNQSAAIQQSQPRQHHQATDAILGGPGNTQTYGTMHGRNQSQQMTPQNFGQQQQSLSHMPSVHVPGRQQGIQQTSYGHTRSQTLGSQQPMPQGGGGHGQPSVNQFGSPEQRPFNTNAGRHVPPQTPQVGSRGQGYQTSANRNARSTPSSQAVQQPALRDNSMALVTIPEVSSAPSVKEQFEKVWFMAERYCWSHVNIVSSQKDGHMPTAIKERLLRTAAPVQAFPLMGVPLTRFMMVTKVVVQWIMKNILKHDSFRGFDLEVDTAIEANKNQIYQSTPAQVKYQLLSNIGYQMSVLQKKPGFDGFVNHLARDRGNQLWQIINPMMHEKSACDWEDLYTLMIEAHTLAQMMYSGADQYRFDTPPGNTMFDKTTMVPRFSEESKSMTTEQLEARGMRIKLALTPHVICKTSTPLGLVSETTVLPARVLIA
ncbi:hypothetical protein LTR10_018944 [Elasticomyces elasticus]|uniref:Uncharacterized protein n=1 Tax=Exophiala sideris TaxID=1016849 RepID=A0ABR0IZY5_9EURO|nr:hypothetical protein LTR10_018944 [Elasticomyces elasticus]KAK5022302.1 hypothetical protein LTS07_010178 [Exophiala sideris]KAK5027114.1 hypothetical protein LTR13_009724 [Exophiala sideris]KAK5051689.1 hypothetical protein LTR69_010189 [Exophiala sideris]KAK5177654.1 hypothetical protein LTR44_009844 [Eurotiomycetes sp. CCFEE 6388]